MTGRSFNKRIGEHYRCIRKNNTTNNFSNFANHILNTGHPFDPDKNYEILHVHNNNNIIKLLENYEICKYVDSDTDDVLNDTINEKPIIVKNLLQL